MPPPEGALNDPSLRTFLARLAGASAARDTSVIKAALDDFVYDDMMEQALTRQEFVTLHLSAPEEFLWPVIDFALDCPFAYGAGERVRSPYLVADPYCQRLSLDEVVSRDGVELRQAPEAASPVIRTLSYDVVDWLPDLTLPGEWVEDSPLRRSSFIRVQSADGIIGFARRGEFLSAGDPYLSLTQIAGAWRIGGIVAGWRDDAWLTLG